MEIEQDQGSKCSMTQQFNRLLAGEQDPQKYNKWLRGARIKMRLSQQKMAEYIGIQVSEYRRLEWGEGREKAYGGVWSTPARAVASFFDVKPNEIFGDGPNGVEPHDAVLLQGDFSRGATSEPSKAYEQGEWSRLLDEALKELPEREEKVLRMRFGFGEKPSDGMTLKEVGEVLKVSRELVRQIEISALKRLKSGRLLAFDPEEADVVRRPCGECNRETTYEQFFVCRRCGKKSCPACWPANDGLCKACVERRDYEAKCEEQFQKVKRKPPYVRAKEAEKRRKRRRLGLPPVKPQKTQYQREQEKIQARVRTGDGFLPPCVEEMLEGYFKRLWERKEFERQVARGRYYYQKKIQEMENRDGQ